MVGEKNKKTAEEEARRLVGDARVTVGLLASLQRISAGVIGGIKGVGGGITTFYEERRDFDEAVALLEKTFESLHALYAGRLLEARRKSDEEGRLISEEVLDHLETQHAKARAELQKIYGSKLNFQGKTEAYADSIARLTEIPAKLKLQLEKEKRESALPI